MTGRHVAQIPSSSVRMEIFSVFPGIYEKYHKEVPLRRTNAEFWKEFFQKVLNLWASGLSANDIDEFISDYDEGPRTGSTPPRKRRRLMDLQNPDNVFVSEDLFPAVDERDAKPDQRQRFREFREAKELERKRIRNFNSYAARLVAAGMPQNSAGVK